MKLEYYYHIGFNRERIMMTYLEGMSITLVVSIFTFVVFSRRSFHTANTHTDSLGEVDVIADSEV
jgi:hypothetical protein